MKTLTNMTDKKSANFNQPNTSKIVSTIVSTVVSTGILLSASSAFAAEDAVTIVIKKSNNTTIESAEKTTVETSESDEKQASAPEIAQEVEQPSDLENDHEHSGDDSSWHIHCYDENNNKCDEEDFDFDFDISDNNRDGFYLSMSAISSVGDDFALNENEDTASEFDLDFSYRVQLLGFFMEAPSLSSRRIHGMYSLSAWGYNFYNSEDWTFDLYYQNSTRGTDGLAGIQTRNQKKRGGIRATGYFDNSHLQFMFSPVSGNSDGSDGIEASISYHLNWQYKNVAFYTNLGAQYRSQEVIARGETKSEESDGLSTSDGISTSAEVGIEYPLSTDWVIGGFAGYSTLSERAIAKRDDNVESGYRAGILLTYVF